MKKGIIYIIALLYLSCFNTSYRQKMCYSALSREIVETDSISLVTRDGSYYTVQISALSPQEIEGSGRMKNQSHSWAGFSGISSIVATPPIGRRVILLASLPKRRPMRLWPISWMSTQTNTAHMNKVAHSPL